MGGANQLHPFQSFYSALGLFGFGGLGSKSTNVILHMSDLALLFFEYRLFIRHHFCTNPLKLGVVPLVADNG